MQPSRNLNRGQSIEILTQQEENFKAVVYHLKNLKKETSQLRSQQHKQIEHSKKLDQKQKCLDIVQELKNLFQEDNFQKTHRPQVNRFQTDFQRTLDEILSIQVIDQRKSGRNLTEMRQSIATMQQSGMGLNPDQCIEYEQVIEEKEKEYEQLVNDIGQIQNIMTEMGQMVDKQGEQLKNVEENVDQTENKCKEANVELMLAKNYDDKRRKKLLILFLIVLFVLGLVLLTIFLLKG